MTPVVLQLDSLAKRFGAIEVTRAVSLNVKAGEIHALIGPNGAGKSTLVAQIAGQLKPDGGRIWLNGEDVTNWSPHRRARKGLSRTFQISSVFRTLNAAANIEVALNARQGRISPWQRSGIGASHRAAQAELNRFGIDADDRPVGALGYGTIRQLELAMGMALSPTVLLLDEPLAGLSSGESQRVVKLLGTLRGRMGMLLIEHDMDAVFSLADRVTVLVGGAVIACGTPAEIRVDAAVRHAYLGDA